MSFVNFPLQTNPPIQSYEELKKKAEQNDANALYWLGVCLWHGEHVVKRTDLASRCYELAALLGSPLAYDVLGDLYRYGKSVTKNIKTACQLLQAAYALGVRRALSAYAMILIEDVKTEASVSEGMSILKYAKDNGDDDAEYYIEEYYPEANQIRSQFNFTDEMRRAWIAMGLESILDDIMRQVVHHKQVFGEMGFGGDDVLFFPKVEEILSKWGNLNGAQKEKVDYLLKLLREIN